MDFIPIYVVMFTHTCAHFDLNPVLCTLMWLLCDKVIQPHLSFLFMGLGVVINNGALNLFGLFQMSSRRGCRPISLVSTKVYLIACPKCGGKMVLKPSWKVLHLACCSSLQCLLSLWRALNHSSACGSPRPWHHQTSGRINDEWIHLIYWMEEGLCVNGRGLVCEWKRACVCMGLVCMLVSHAFAWILQSLNIITKRVMATISARDAANAVLYMLAAHHFLLICWLIVLIPCLVLFTIWSGIYLVEWVEPLPVWQFHQLSSTNCIRWNESLWFHFQQQSSNIHYIPNQFGTCAKRYQKIDHIVIL